MASGKIHPVLIIHPCSNDIIKFADNTTTIGLNKDSNELAYREVDLLAAWSEDNNLTLNTFKTKELIMNFRKNAVTQSPIHSIGGTVECVTSFNFLRIHILQDLSKPTNCSSLVMRAHQCAFFLRTLRMKHVLKDIMETWRVLQYIGIYWNPLESTMIYCNLLDYSSSGSSRQQALMRKLDREPFLKPP